MGAQPQFPHAAAARRLRRAVRFRVLCPVLHWALCPLLLCALCAGLLGALTLPPGGVALAQNQPAKPADLDEAILGAGLRLESNPANRVLRIYLVRLHFTQGARAVEDGKAPAALKSFAEGLRVAREGDLRFSESEDLLKVADSSLARAVQKLGKDRPTLMALEQQIGAAPELENARYSLGVTLMRSAEEGDFPRGMELLAALRAEAAPELQAKAAQAGGALAYERALAEFKAGRPGAAREALEGALGRFGERPFPNDVQNQNLRFAFAKALDDTGDTAGALREYEALHAENPAFALPGGTALQRLLANAYYKHAVELLTTGGGESVPPVIALLEKLEALEGPNSADLHHARYLAYRKSGDGGAAERERQTIRKLDPAYYDALFGAR